MERPNRVYVIAEIGINHNGDMDIARRLIDVAAEAGCDAVKFQKRTVDVVYTAEELAQPREHPWGTTNGELKRRLEFTSGQHYELWRYADDCGLRYGCSPWDLQALADVQEFADFLKIASPCLTDCELVEATAKTCGDQRRLLLSTGMSTPAEIEHAETHVWDYTATWILMHCTSAYPCPPDNLNLRVIEDRKRFRTYGYSGHETGLQTTIAAAALGARCVERHITLDRSMFGSDQAASIEPEGLKRLVRDIRTLEVALGDGVKRVYESELPVKSKLRRKDQCHVEKAAITI